MWPARKPPVDTLLIGAQRLVWWGASVGQELFEAIPDMTVSERSCAFDGLAQAVGQLQTGLSDKLGQPRVQRSLQVLISDQWMSLETFPWSDALFNSAEAENHLRQALGSAGYDVDTDSALRIDDRRYGEPCWGAAYPKALLDIIKRFATDVGYSTVSGQSLSVACLDALQCRNGFTGAVGICDGHWLRLFHVGQKTNQALGYRQFVSVAADIPLAWQRTRLTYPAVGSSGLTILNLNPEPIPEMQGISTLNAGIGNIPLIQGKALKIVSLGSTFYRAHPLALRELLPSSSRLRNAWIGALTLMLLGVVGAAVGVQDIVTAHDKVRLQTRASNSVKPEPRQSSNPEGDEEVLRRLDFQPDEILRVLIPQEPIAVWIVSVELDGETQEPAPRKIQMQVQAKDMDAIGAYLKDLEMRPHIGGVELLRHTILDSDPAKPMRFELEVAWRA